ncbi:SIR2 family NAD-dependent protein deacylase [Pedobacter sp. JCM 36344]|uniref:SIR2 family NAD-dependent protein deacylase n=1 Tax=Pedobacter sp. JCM 36344 TaxID=3374280 RepID=UPI00397BE8B0
MQNIVILTGAGISAESGLKTFRDSDGLWEGYNVEDVATQEAWKRNPSLVQGFYNERRKAVLAAQPNAAHLALVELEEKYNVYIITQNVDDLHERAGSTNVLHLHGVITRSQSDVDSNLTYPIEGWELTANDLCEYGKPLRAHVVWFGEQVPNMDQAASLCAVADVFAVIGTSLQVYPAAGLTQYVPQHIQKYVVDPNSAHQKSDVKVIKEKATVGVPEMVSKILNNR